MKMTLNVLLKLIIEAKRSKCKNNNGQLFVRFLSCIADGSEIEIRRKFFDYDDKEKEFKRIDKLIDDFIPDGNVFPYYEKFTFRHFENCIKNFNGVDYSEMEKFCNDILDSKKIDSLVYTLLEIMRNDDTFKSFIYLDKNISKQDFFNITTEPKQVSVVPLLIGLLYYVYKNPSKENTDNLYLKNLPRKTKRCTVCQKSKNIKMTLNVLLNLVIQAKHDKSNNGKGRLLVRFLDCIADGNETEIRKKFFDDAHKGEAFHKIDKLILRFIPKGKGYPYERFTFRCFENCIGSPERFRVHLADMKNFCNDILDTEKIDSLVYTLLEIIRKDYTFDSVIYGGNIISKQSFFGTITTPKQVCVEALLLGLLYHVHKNQSEENAGNLELKNPPEIMKYCIVRWEGRNEHLNTDIKISPIDVACRISGISKDKWCYLDAYVNRLEADNQMNRFLIQYAMPFIAYEIFNNDILLLLRTSYSVSGNNVFTFIHKAFDIFLSDEKIYYSYTALRGFNKTALQNDIENVDFIQAFVSSGLMEINGTYLEFVHENIANYFMARHIFNMLNAFISAYGSNSTPDIQKTAYCRLNLNKSWFYQTEDLFYEILGNICGDSENIPENHEYYLGNTHTILDSLLDIYRSFNLEYDEMNITDNVLTTMSAARNKRLCEVNFSGLPMPEFIPHGIKFRECKFINSHIYELNIFESVRPGLFLTAVSLDNKLVLIQFAYNYAVLWDIDKNKVVAEVKIFTQFKPTYDQIWEIDKNSIVSEVDFTRVDITQFTESYEKFYNLYEEIYRQLSYFKDCDFHGAVFHDNDYREKLKNIGAIAD